MQNCIYITKINEINKEIAAFNFDLAVAKHKQYEYILQLYAEKEALTYQNADKVAASVLVENISSLLIYRSDSLFMSDYLMLGSQIFGEIKLKSEDLRTTFLQICCERRQLEKQILEARRRILTISRNIKN